MPIHERPSRKRGYRTSEFPLTPQNPRPGKYSGACLGDGPDFVERRLWTVGATCPVARPIVRRRHQVPGGALGRPALEVRFRGAQSSASPIRRTRTARDFVRGNLCPMVDFKQADDERTSGFAVRRFVLCRPSNFRDSLRSDVHFRRKRLARLEPVGSGWDSLVVLPGSLDRGVDTPFFENVGEVAEARAGTNLLDGRSIPA